MVSIPDLSAVTSPPTYDALPECPAFDFLKSRKQWVVWKYTEVNGRMTKPPYSAATGFKCSIVNSINFATYDDAVSRAKRGFDGIGFALVGDGIVAGDLDNCRDPVTGELEAWAAEIVALNETYIEVSPSGAGLRLLWLGEIPSATKADAMQVEIYDRGRYVTITGEHIAGPRALNPAPLTYAALIARAGVRPVAPAPAPRSGNYFRNVNEAALGELSTWVPAIFARAKWQSNTQSYRVASSDLTRDLEEDLSFSPTGIRDFGLEEGRTAIDIVVEFRNAEPADAAMWLCERMGRSPESFGWVEADGGSAEAGKEIAQRILRKGEDIIDADTGEVLTPADMFGNLTLATIGDWTQPTGLIAEITEWILHSSRRPNRTLAVSSAVAIMASFCSRHLFGPTGTALNLYIIALAPTAVGKNRPLSAIAEVAGAAGFPKLQTTLKGFSVSAVESMVSDYPCVCATVDEIGVNLFGKLSGKNAASFELSIRGALLELWSREQGMAPFATHRRAQEDSKQIENPALSIFGTSTKEAFFSSISGASVKDGFLNRFLLATASPRARARDVSEAARRPPAKLVAALAGLIPQVTGNLATALGPHGKTTKLPGDRIDWDDRETRIAAEAFEEDILGVMDADAETAPLLGRIFEYTVRLAALHAVSRAGRTASVTMADLAWGASWSVSSARLLVEGAGGLQAGSDYEKKFNSVRDAIQTGKLVSKRDLSRQVRSVEPRERDRILDHLMAAGFVQRVNEATKGRPAEKFRWVG